MVMARGIPPASAGGFLSTDKKPRAEARVPVPKSPGRKPGDMPRKPLAEATGMGGESRYGNWIAIGSLGVPAASAAAMSRMSCVIFIEQYFGPHMLQKWALLNVSCGSVWS